MLISVDITMCPVSQNSGQRPLEASPVQFKSMAKTGGVGCVDAGAAAAGVDNGCVLFE